MTGWKYTIPLRRILEVSCYNVISVMPSKTKDILDILGTNDVELVWGKLKQNQRFLFQSLFSRESVDAIN